MLRRQVKPWWGERVPPLSWDCPASAPYQRPLGAATISEIYFGICSSGTRKGLRSPPSGIAEDAAHPEHRPGRQTACARLHVRHVSTEGCVAFRAELLLLTNAKRLPRRAGFLRPASQHCRKSGQRETSQPGLYRRATANSQVMVFSLRASRTNFGARHGSTCSQALSDAGLKWKRIEDPLANRDHLRRSGRRLREIRDHHGSRRQGIHGAP